MSSSLLLVLALCADKVLRRGMLRASPSVGANYYTPEITKVKLHWKIPLNIHWESDNPLGSFPVNSTGEVTILWKLPLTSENPLENATEHPLNNATENPR